MSVIECPELTIEQFESGNVDVELFDHEAHVYIGWLYVQKYELADAIARFNDALRFLTVKLGVAGKYHVTITWIFLLLIAERSRTGEDWQTFIARNPDLIEDSRSTLGRYYSEKLLFSEAARKRFVLPDQLRSA
jgi:hypothetical protein